MQVAANASEDLEVSDSLLLVKATPFERLHRAPGGVFATLQRGAGERLDLSHALDAAMHTLLRTTMAEQPIEQRSVDARAVFEEHPLG